METISHWEKLGRAEKVARLLEAIDAEAERQGMPRVAGKAQADVLRQAPAATWAQMAREAGCKHPPSGKTVEAVAAAVEARDDLSDVPF